MTSKLYYITFTRHVYNPKHGNMATCFLLYGTVEHRQNSAQPRTDLRVKYGENKHSLITVCHTIHYGNPKTLILDIFDKKHSMKLTKFRHSNHSA